MVFVFFNDTATTEIYTLSLHDALPIFRLGASPRATLQLLRASRAYAALAGRDYVSPDDVAALGVAVLAHRVLPSTDAQLSRRTVSDVVAHAITSVHVPDRR